MNISILGKGAWGLAIGELLQSQGHSVEWPDKGQARISDGAGMIIIALPTQVVREVLQGFQGKAEKIPVVSLSKGIDIETGQRISQMAALHWPEAPFVALSGPSLAGELRKKVPTAMVAASRSDDWASQVQQIFHGPFLRVYRSQDLAGVEWGGGPQEYLCLGCGNVCRTGIGGEQPGGVGDPEPPGDDPDCGSFWGTRTNPPWPERNGRFDPHFLQSGEPESPGRGALGGRGSFRKGLGLGRGNLRGRALHGGPSPHSSNPEHTGSRGGGIVSGSFSGEASERSLALPSFPRPQRGARVIGNPCSTSDSGGGMMWGYESRPLAPHTSPGE